MAIPVKVQNRTDELVSELKTLKAMSLNDRDDYIEIAIKSCNDTNGLTDADKLQACAENIANLTYLFIRDKIEAAKRVRGWPDLVFRCRNQIVAIVALVCAMLCFRPELAGLLSSLGGLIAK